MRAFSCCSDPDERIVRMAAREIVRRKPTDYENVLSATDDQRPRIGPAGDRPGDRAGGFDQFWQRFDQLDGHPKAGRPGDAQAAAGRPRG